ncbi:hypothetical protein J3F84DRAFT_48691 [Trichoderma pleuroticola]
MKFISGILVETPLGRLLPRCWFSHEFLPSNGDVNARNEAATWPELLGSNSKSKMRKRGRCFKYHGEIIPALISVMGQSSGRDILVIKNLIDAAWPRTSRNDAITQPHPLASPPLRSRGLFSRCQNGKMNKGKSWGAAVVRQADKSAPVATMIPDCANVANAGTVPNCRPVALEVLIARYLIGLCEDNVS